MWRNSASVFNQRNHSTLNTKFLIFTDFCFMFVIFFFFCQNFITHRDLKEYIYMICNIYAPKGKLCAQWIIIKVKCEKKYNALNKIISFLILSKTKVKCSVQYSGLDQIFDFDNLFRQYFTTYAINLQYELEEVVCNDLYSSYM